MAKMPMDYEPDITYGTAVDLSGYTDSSNRYTCTSDGFLRLVCKSSNTTDYPQLTIRLNSGYTADFMSSSVLVRHAPIFLKKGTTIYISANSSKIDSIAFIPITS